MIPALQYGEFFADPQIQHLGVVIDLSGAAEGLSSDIAPPWHLSDTPASVRRRAPQFGEHTAEICEQILAAGEWAPAEQPR